jgi:hypothetical protein
MTHAAQVEKFNELVMNFELYNTLFKWYSQLGGNDGACIELALKARQVGNRNANPVDVYLGRVKTDEMEDRGRILLEQKEAMLAEVRNKFAIGLAI